MSDHTWDIEKTGKNAFVINIYYPEPTMRNDFSFKFLLSFDRHWDNPKSNQDLQAEHLDEVKRLKTFCLDGGDLFCAMQGKYDRRSNKSDIRPEHQNGEYLDSLVNSASDFFEPYANDWEALVLYPIKFSEDLSIPIVLILLILGALFFTLILVNF